MLDFVSKGRITTPVEITFQSVGDYPYHWHDCLEIIFVLEGTIEIFAGTDNIVLKTGDIEIINFNEIHRIVGKTGNIVLSLKIQAELAQEIISDIKDIVFNSMVVSYHEKKREAIDVLGNLIAKFALSITGKVDKIDNIIKADIEEILLYLTNNFDIVIHTLKSKTVSSDERKILLARYRRITNYIYTKFSGKIGLREIAEKENLSLYFLSHEIKNLFGDGFQELLNYRRIHKSMKLLLDTNMNLTEIAYECGYSAPRYFSQYFKKILGTTPLKFRKQFRQAWEQKNSQKWKNDIDTDSALHIIKSYLLTDNTKEKNDLQEILIDAGMEGQNFYRDWKEFALKSNHNLVKIEKINKFNLHSDSMYAGAKSIWEELTFLNAPKSAKKEKIINLYTEHGLKRPIWFAYFLLSLLGKRVLDRGESYGVFRQEDSIQILLYNYSNDWEAGLYYDNDLTGEGIPKEINLKITNLNHSDKVTRYRLDETNCSIFYKWMQMGKPEKFLEEEITLLDRILYPEVVFGTVEETADFTVSLPPFSMELIVIN